jgi:HK97 family phage portal protein
LGFWSNLFGRFQTEHEYTWQSIGALTSSLFPTDGNALIHNTYETNPDVYSVIKKIIDVSKALPWVIEYRQSSGNWKALKESTIYELFDKPNISKGYTISDIDEQIFLYLLCAGNAYVYGGTRFNSDLIEELDILPPAYVDIESNNNFFLPELKYRFSLGQQRIFTKEQIAHIKFFNPAYSSILDSHKGLSAIQSAIWAVKAGSDRWTAQASMLENKGVGGILTGKGDRPLTKEESDKINEGFKKQVGGAGKFNKVHVSNKELGYIQLAMSPTDLKIIESGIISLRTICNVLGVDSSLFNDPENKTYSNRTEAEKSLYTNAVMPLCDKAGTRLAMFLGPNHHPGKTIRIRKDYSSVECLQENFHEKAKTYALLKNSGIITANVAAEALKQPTSNDENADKLIISTILVEGLGQNQSNNEQAQTEANT